MAKSNRKNSKAMKRRLGKKAGAKVATKGARPVPSQREMDGALNAVAERIKKRLVKNDKSNALGKYVIAAEVKAVMDGEAKYGSRAVEKLARKLGLEWQLLYRWAEVATAWPDHAAFHKLVQRRNKYGIPLTWSHLEVLTEVADPARRKKLIKMTLVRGLSVRELRARKGGSVAAGSTRQAASSPSKVSLKGTIVTLSKQAEVFADELARWRKVLSRIPGGAPEADLKKSLKVARRKQKAVVSACQATLKAIESVLGRKRSTAKSPKRTVTILRVNKAA